jgi:hypothetical protein
MTRTILIGDLHGCADEAVKLLEKCRVTPEDWVIFLGDYVDRGPDSAKCCDLVRHREQVQSRIAGIIGNHEETHLRHEDDFQRGRLGSIPPTHVATRMQLKPEHYAWFRQLPFFIRLPEHNAIAVHAGMYPGRPIEAQTEQHLTHIQMIKPFDKWGNPTHNYKSMWPSRVPDNEDGWKFWTTFWKGPERIIFGHSVLNKPLITDRVVGIDGGACFGMELWAFILPDNQLVSVKGHGSYDPDDLKRRGNRNKKLFLIDGDVGTY